MLRLKLIIFSKGAQASVREQLQLIIVRFRKIWTTALDVKYLYQTEISEVLESLFYRCLQQFGDWKI